MKNREDIQQFMKNRDIYFKDIQQFMNNRERFLSSREIFKIVISNHIFHKPNYPPIIFRRREDPIFI